MAKTFCRSSGGKTQRGAEVAARVARRIEGGCVGRSDRFLLKKTSWLALFFLPSRDARTRVVAALRTGNAYARSRWTQRTRNRLTQRWNLVRRGI
jgi:hypothetical protein